MPEIEIRDIVNFIAFFVIIWWVVFFTALPIGVEKQARVQKGNDPGAPKDPKLRQKIIATTIVSAIVTLVLLYTINAEIVDFKQ